MKLLEESLAEFQKFVEDLAEILRKISGVIACVISQEVFDINPGVIPGRISWSPIGSSQMFSELNSPMGITRASNIDYCP